MKTNLISLERKCYSSIKNSIIIISWNENVAPVLSKNESDQLETEWLRYRAIHPTLDREWHIGKYNKHNTYIHSLYIGYMERPRAGGPVFRQVPLAVVIDPCGSL